MFAVLRYRAMHTDAVRHAIKANLSDVAGVSVARFELLHYLTLRRFYRFYRMLSLSETCWWIRRFIVGMLVPF